MALRAHAVAAHLAGQGAGEADDAFLGGGVVRLAGVAEARRRRGVDDDAALALLPEVGAGGPRDVEVTPQVDGDDGVPVLGRHVEDHAVAEDAGVVDDDVQPSPVVEGQLDELLAGLRLDDVVVVGDRLAAHRLDLLHDLLGGSRLAVPLPSRAAPTSLMTTFAPSDARASASPRPIPRPAPVTIATLPFSLSPIWFLLCFWVCSVLHASSFITDSRFRRKPGQASPAPFRCPLLPANDLLPTSRPSARWRKRRLWSRK